MEFKSCCNLCDLSVKNEFANSIRLLELTLYRVLEDKDNPQKEIVVERAPEDKPPISLKDLKVLPVKDADPFKDFMKNVVFSTNPRAKEPGILCHKCRLSNVADSIGLP